MNETEESGGSMNEVEGAKYRLRETVRDNLTADEQATLLRVLKDPESVGLKHITVYSWGRYHEGHYCGCPKTAVALALGKFSLPEPHVEDEEFDVRFYDGVWEWQAGLETDEDSDDFVEHVDKLALALTGPQPVPGEEYPQSIWLWRESVRSKAPEVVRFLVSVLEELAA